MQPTETWYVIRDGNGDLIIPDEVEDEGLIIGLVEGPRMDDAWYEAWVNTPLDARPADVTVLKVRPRGTSLPHTPVYVPAEDL